MFSFLNGPPCSLRWFTLTILASLTSLQSLFGAQTLIPAGAVWRVKADGSDQGTAWSQPSFDASGWPGGFGPLGFGDPHIATVLPSGFVTYYFRGEFVVNNPSTVSSLLLRLLRDDGAVVYLNGTEVRRDNMPAGPIAFNTLATVAVSGAGETNYFESAIPTGLLVAGANVLAVEVHQNSISSSDLGFDAALIAEMSDLTPPTIVSATATYGGPAVTVGFSEPVDPVIATDVFSYIALGSDGNPVSFDSATISADQRTVTLYVSLFSSFVPGVSYILDVCCVCDTSFNCIPGTESIQITFPAVPSTLVARGSVWRYLDTGIDPGPAWFDPSYDDSSWASGPAELGYGDNDEATLINRIDPNTGASLLTAYFRQTFNVTDTSGIPGLSLHLWRDDGAIVYINGTEVFRNNMPGGPVIYSTLANALANDDGDIALDVGLVSSVLVNGANVIAVEVHQQSPVSSDISFDLELLVGTVSPNERPIANSQSVIVQFNTPTPITLTGSDPNGDPITFIIVTSSAHGTLTGTPPNVTYTPNANFTGSDNFTFKVNDGQVDSAVATVSLDVRPGSSSPIARGSVWRYLDTGIDPGTAWISPSFDDSSWASGPAELGYGDFNEATVISSTDSSGQRLITAYFRHTFNVTDVSAISGLSLRLWRDDGAIVYLNGVEVFRNNMPEGPVNYSTFAPAVAPDDGNIAVLAQLSASLLVNGANVMAVEVHQQSLTSSDISFDLQLDPSETQENHPPTANNQSVGTYQNTPVGITLTGSDPDGDPLSFTLTSFPSHGTLSGSLPNLTYTPAAGYLGSDAFTFTVSDGQFESASASVSIQVIPPPNPPDIVSAIAGCGGLSVAVAFDEPVDPASSQDVFNYIISDSNGNSFFIFNAVLLDPQTVVLSVDPSTPLIPGQAYVLDAFFICDTVGDCSGQLTVPIQFETVPPQVACSVAVHTLLPANNQLVNVGLSASASEGALQVKVFSDEPEVASLEDAFFTGGTLQLRARKSPGSNGRVYLIVVTSADGCGNVGVCCTTVVVPATGSQASLNAVNAQAAAAQAQCSPTGAPSTPYRILP